MKDSKIKSIIIESNKTIMDALKLMDASASKLLIVLESSGKFFSLISIGDIQRAIIKNVPLNKPLIEILHERPLITAKKDEDIEVIKELMLKHRLVFMPIIDDDKRLFDVIFWDDILKDKKASKIANFNLPIVVMAGGFGSRLKPLTNVLPKALIPLGDKSMLEEIFDRFSQYGSNTFYISVNYKAELIEFYLKNQNLPYVLNFFKEDKPLGTAGSLSLLKDTINKTFFVTNCDILIEQDYSEILNFHNENKNEITIVAAIKNYSIPYGTIETGDNGQLLSLIEKPEIPFKINSGMYILEPHLLNEIPESRFYHITDLISKLTNENRKVGVFPIQQKDWIDVGEINSYLKLINW